MKDQLFNIWNKVNSKIPIIIVLAFIFIGLDIWYVDGILEVYGNMEKYERFAPPPKPKEFVPPPAPEIEVFDPDKLQDIPPQYQILKKTNIFAGPDIKQGDKVDLPEPPEDFPDDRPPVPAGELLKIDGFTAKGLVYGADHKIGAVFIEGDGGKSYYGKEGRRLTGTRIVIKQINPKSVILSQPGKQDTEIFFQEEEFLLRWNRGEPVDPIELKRKEMKNRPKPAPVAAPAATVAPGAAAENKDAAPAGADASAGEEEEEEE